MKAPSPRSFPLLALLALVACSTPNQVADFARNEVLYVDVPFHTKVPGDRPVFVAPVVDARSQAPLPTHERGFPIAYASDDFWERPVTEMLGEVLTRQLASSELFPAIEERATPQALCIKPALVTFVGGSSTAMSGSRSFAEVALRLQVFGPVGADGTRPVLHEQTYGNRQTTELELNPASPYRLFGRALQLTMQKAMVGLDGSNVARSDVPAATGVPAEASSPAR